MRQVECSRCQATLPIADTFELLGQTVCEPCGNELIAIQDQPLAEGEVVRNVDPTICRWCDFDGQNDLSTVCAQPICTACESRLRNFPFPGWIKASFVALVVLGIASFIYNYRFADALFASRRAMKAWAAGDIDTATQRMERAATLVPEVGEFRDQADMFRGVQLLRDNRSKEALPLLVKMEQKNPGIPVLRQFVLQAELGVAFDEKHYDVMLEKSLALAELAPEARMSKYMLASAYACRYAETGDVALKDKSLAALAEGDKMATTDDKLDDAEHDNFKQRIAYRLATRDVIDKKTFDERFPQGWQEEANPQ